MIINSVKVVLDDRYRIVFVAGRIMLSIRKSEFWDLVMSVDNPVFGMGTDDGTDDGTYGCMGRKYAPSVETAIEIVRRFGNKKEPE